MAMTGAQRQKKWRDANRALFNLRRRNLRKNTSGVGVTRSREAVEAERRQDQAEPCDTVLPSKSKIEELRKLMETASIEPTMPMVKPLIYRNDITGQVISERAWNDLQRHKEAAKNAGYTLDEYSQ